MNKRRHYLACLLFCWFGLSGNSYSQYNNAPYLDLLLFSQFGEFCTMCEAVVLCQQGSTIPEYEAVPDQGSFTLLHLQTRTFWSQVSTIWEWFMNNFNEQPMSGHRRPMTVFTVIDGQWQPPVNTEVHLDIEPPLLSFDEQQIHRRERSWWQQQTNIGYCQRLPLWPALDSIERHSPAYQE